MIKKIISITVLILFIFSLSACGEPPVGISYNSIEELQSEWPDYYYFDFGLNITEVTACEMLSRESFQPDKDKYDYNYYGYYISFKIILEPFQRYASLSVFSDNKKERSIERDYYLNEKQIIDNIECSLYYYRLSNEYKKCHIYFSIDQVFYMISLTLVVDSNEDLSFDGILSIIEPIIINRYKGVSL